MPNTNSEFNPPLPPVDAYEIVGDSLVVPEDYIVTEDCLEQAFSCDGEEG